MGELVNIIQNCPQCGQRLLILTNEYAEFRECEHYRWHTNLGSISNDEAVLNGRIRMRLWKR